MWRMHCQGVPSGGAHTGQGGSAGKGLLPGGHHLGAGKEPVQDLARQRAPDTLTRAEITKSRTE